MKIKIRDWSVLGLGVLLVVLGGFQIVYDLKNFQIKDFVLSAILFIPIAWLFFEYFYKKDKTLYDEYYAEQLYKFTNYALATTLASVWIIVWVFEKDNIISISYIYGAIRLGLGLSLLYFSFVMMRDNEHE